MKEELSKRIFDAERKVTALQHGFASIPVPTTGDLSSITGVNLVPDNLDYIWASVQAPSNTTIANGACGVPHAWSQIVQLANGCNNNTNTTLFGTTNTNAAYDANGGFLTANTVTKLYPGAAWFNSTSNTYQQEWWFEKSGTSSGINACSCCCCCVPCEGTQIWLTIGQFFLTGCDLPTVSTGIGPAVLTLSGNCYTGSGTVTDAIVAPSTLTWSAMVCCDPNDKRKCPVLKLLGTLTVPSGDYAGTYNFCIGPIDFPSDLVLNCHQLDPVYPDSPDPTNWQATIDTNRWGCDPNSDACQCPVQPDTGESITIECLCQACPITGIPDTLTADITMGHDNGCAAATGNIVTTITLNYYSSVPASGTPCTVSDDYGQPCWYGESADLGDGCRLGLVLVCRPLSLATGEFGITLCTIQDQGGNCATMNAILSTCWNAVGQTTTVCCDPFGIIIANGAAFPYVTIGNPTCV